MRNAGLGSWPERHLRSSAHKPALWFEGTTTTHGEFALRVRRAAAALTGLGVQRWSGTRRRSGRRCASGSPA